jgi:hypothetical protein
MSQNHGNNAKYVQTLLLGGESSTHSKSVESHGSTEVHE